MLWPVFAHKKRELLRKTTSRLHLDRFQRKHFTSPPNYLAYDAHSSGPGKPLPFILTRGSDSCRNVGYPNRTLCCVNMLATSSPSSKSLDFEIRLINLDTGWCITQDRYYGHSCKWSMSALSTIEWWTTNQSVDSYFCFGITVRIFTINFDCCPLKKDSFNVNKVDE